MTDTTIASTAPDPTRQPDTPATPESRQDTVARGLTTISTLLANVGPLPALPFVTGYTSGHVEATWQLMNDTSDLAAQKALAREVIRAVNAVLPGAWAKSEGHVADWFRFTRQVDGAKLEILVTRAAVCERVITGTRTVTERIPDPDHVVPTVAVTREVEDFEWRCQPLLDDGAVAS